MKKTPDLPPNFQNKFGYSFSISGKCENPTIIPIHNAGGNYLRLYLCRHSKTGRYIAGRNLKYITSSEISYPFLDNHSYESESAAISVQLNIVVKRFKAYAFDDQRYVLAQTEIMESIKRFIDENMVKPLL